MPDKVGSYGDIPEASHEAVHAARDAAQALEVAREQQVQKLGNIVQERFERVLAFGTEQEKSMILARVPYICQDIKDINGTLSEIKRMMEQVKRDLDAKDEKNEKKYVTIEAFSPFRWGATVVASVVITTLVGAFLSQLLIK